MIEAPVVFRVGQPGRQIPCIAVRWSETRVIDAIDLPRFILNFGLRIQICVGRLLVVESCAGRFYATSFPIKNVIEKRTIPAGDDAKFTDREGRVGCLDHITV
jgi:hypothetical protein